MLKLLPLILAAGHITPLCHSWVLQKSMHLWPGITSLNQTKMSSACWAVTVNVRERYVGTGQLRKTSDDPFDQHARNTGTAVRLRQCKVAWDGFWQILTPGCFFRGIVTNIYVKESKFVSCLTLMPPIWSVFLCDFEPLIKYIRSSCST